MAVVQYRTIVEGVDDPVDKHSLWRAFYSAVVTLTLGVLGSTVLPVPYAFSKLGVVPGVVIMLVVAFVNDCTCCMLVRASAATGRYGYEALAEWAGGMKARVITQVSLILLLYGTLCGGLAFLSDVARVMVLKGFPDVPEPQSSPAGLPGTATWALNTPPLHTWPPWDSDTWLAFVRLMQRDGRPLMLFVVATVLYPLCLQRHIRQFEKAATVGVVVVVALMVLIVARAVALGFPAVASGQLPVWGFHAGAHEALPEAFAVLGFAFYMQPMLMPLLAEMPHGEVGTRLSENAVHTVLFGVACAAYGVVGVFGAATYGDSTESNIMVNDLLPGQPYATLALYASLLVYLCCGMVTTHYALRASLEVLLTSEQRAGVMGTSRRVVLTTCIILAALAVAVTFPTYAERIFALTGCTAVCLVCYCIPVYIHLRLHDRLHSGEHVLPAPLKDAPSGPHTPAPGGHAAHAGAMQQRDCDIDALDTHNSSSTVDLVIVPGAGVASGLPPTVVATSPHTATTPAHQQQPQPVLASSTHHHSNGKPTCHHAGVGAVSGGELHQPLLADHTGGERDDATTSCAGWCRHGKARRRRSCWELVCLYTQPVLIVTVGVGCSVAGLYVGAMDVINSMKH